jgi:hypothetical protein
MVLATDGGLTRRDMLTVVGAAAAGGYALAVDTVLARAITTNSPGLVSRSERRHRRVSRWLGALALTVATTLGTARGVEAHRIDVDAVWRSDGAVFSEEQLAVIEKILTTTRCKDEKSGCGYRHDGKPVKRGTAPDVRIIPWSVSPQPAYLVRADYCGAGGCDEGLFVRIDGRWRLLIESFGVLEREPGSTRGFRDLRFRPRGGAPFRLVWDGRSYQPATE